MGKTKIKMTQKIEKYLTKIGKTLKERGVKKDDFSDLFEDLLEKNDTENLNKYINDLTPMEWKLKKMLTDEAYKSKFEELTEGRVFGLEGEI